MPPIAIDPRNSRRYISSKNKSTNMSKLRIVKFLAVTAITMFSLNACAGSKTTTLKLSGTRGAAFEGRYQLGDIVSTVSGTLPAQFKFENANLDAWEFRKLDRTASLRVATYHGWRRGLRVKTKPGMLGARLDSVGGRHYEILE